MRSIGAGRGVRHLVLAAVAGGGVLLTAAGGQAQEGNFLELLFGGARPAQPVQPAVNPYAADPYAARRRAEARRARVIQRRQVQTRYAALPRPDDTGISGKQPVDRQAILDDPRGALLRDATLRPGDIVVMPSGPKVFAGTPGKTHRMSAFEDVKHSRLIDARTRAQLVAMMVPVGAMTPDQARKAMSVRLKLVPQEEAQLTEAAAPIPGHPETAGPRVIAPWTGGGR